MFSPFQAYQDEGYSEDPLTNRAISSENAVPGWIQNLPEQERARIAIAIINDLPTSMVADIYERLRPRLCLDFIERLPTEVCLKVLSYLDPNTLINLALTSRAAQSLAFDWKLWSRLYYSEGWKTIPGEIETFQQTLNVKVPPLMRTRSEDDDQGGHRSGKRRALSNFVAGTSPNKTHDVEMLNVNQSAEAIPQMAPLFGEEASEWSNDISRVNVGSSALVQEPTEAESMDFQYGRSITPTWARENTLSDISNLVMTDRDTGRQRLNWRNLYTQRRRLESNWDAGRYVNFQIPHPHYMHEAHSECIYTIQFEGRYLVSGSRDKTLRIWDMDTRRLAIPPLIGHLGSVLCLQFDASSEEDLIVSGSSDASVILWKFSTGQAIKHIKHAHSEPVLNVRFDHRILVTCSKDKVIKIFNRRDLRGNEVGYPGQEKVPASTTVPIVLKNFGYDPSPRDDLPLIPAYTQIGVLNGHGAAVNAIQIWNNEIVSASGDRQLKLWDWPRQLCIKTFIGHSKGIACVQYDGRRIVSGSSDNEVKVFDRQSGLEVASLKAHSNLVRTVQAGFGDLPDSVERDSRLAEEVDRQFFRTGALRDGTTLHSTSNRDELHSAEPVIPGYLTAKVYGAKLPPGGGGGIHGRIVSGSYDESVIIWRRDKNGAWIPKHTLKQEDAARSAAAAAAMYADVTTSPGPTEKSTSACIFNPRLPTSDAFFNHFIHKATCAGPMAFRQLLKSYPQIFDSPHLQTVIERERDTVLRAHLKTIYDEQRTIVEMARHTSLSRRCSPHSGPPDLTSPATLSGLRLVQNHNTQMPVDFAPQAPSSIDGIVQQSHHFDALASASNQQLLSYNEMLQQNLHVHSIPPPLLPVPSVPHLAYPAQALTTNGGDPPQEITTTARVFKLQFDARRIVCCSQTNVIIGWDFACDDEKIIEASRFFAGVN